MSQPESNKHLLPVYADHASALKRRGFLESAGVAHELGNLIQIASSAVNIIARSSRFDVTPQEPPLIVPALLSGSRFIRQVAPPPKPVTSTFRTP